MECREGCCGGGHRAASCRDRTTQDEYVIAHTHGLVDTHVVHGANGLSCGIVQRQARVRAGDGDATGRDAQPSVLSRNCIISSQLQLAGAATYAVGTDAKCVLAGCTVRALHSKRSSFDGRLFRSSRGDDDDLLVCHVSPCL